MKCPYTKENMYDAGDGVVMCESCRCWGFSKQQVQYCLGCGLPHDGECKRPWQRRNEVL